MARPAVFLVCWASFLFIWLRHPSVEARNQIRSHPIRELLQRKTIEDNEASCEHQPMVRANDWMTNTIKLDLKRHGWFYNREPFQPIVGDEQGNLIAGVLFTNSKEVFKMTVIFPPLHPEEESRECKVILKSSSTNSTTSFEASGTITEDTWHCSLRIDALPSDEYNYSVIYEANPELGIIYTYEGKIPAPNKKEYPRIAAMGCFGPGTTIDKSDLVAATLKQQPDLLVFQGDQTYFHHALAYGFIELIYALNELTRSIPTIVQVSMHV